MRYSQGLAGSQSLNLSRLPIQHKRTLRILRIILVQVTFILMRSTWSSCTITAVAVPEVVSLRLNSIRSGDDFDEVTPCNFNGWNLRHRETDQVSQHATNDGGVTDDKQILLFTFQLDEYGVKTH